VATLDTLFDSIALLEKRLINDPDRIQSSGLESQFTALKKLFKFHYSRLKSAITMRRFFLTSLPSSSLQFSLLDVVFPTTPNKITSRRFQPHLRISCFCSGISFHLFIFSCSVAFTIP